MSVAPRQQSPTPPLAIHSRYLEGEAKEDNIYTRLSYQDGAYLALPSKYRTAIHLWINKEQRSAGAEFPFTGAINKANIEFSISKNDYEIVPIGKGSLREPQAMTDYNRTVKSEEQAAVKFSSFPDGEYTINELETLGFNHHNVDSYYKNDWLSRRKKGRAYVYSKKFV